MLKLMLAFDADVNDAEHNEADGNSVIYVEFDIGIYVDADVDVLSLRLQ